MNWIDWVAVAVIALSTLSGFRRGLVAGALSLVGLVAGVIVALRVGPKVVDVGGSIVPFVSLGSVVVGAIIGQWVGGLVGRWARRSLSILPPLRWLDSLGGLVLGCGTGLIFCWVAGTAVVQIPGQDGLRRTVRQSALVSELTALVVPERVLDAIGQIDPFLTIVGPSAGVGAPDGSILRDPEVVAARESVVRIRGVACGVGYEGSGWIAGDDLVVTNAHVVAGVVKPRIDRGAGQTLVGRVVAFDAANDVAVVQVPGLSGRTLGFGEPSNGSDAAALGYPGNGPYRARAARVGRQASVPASRDVYGSVQVGREIVAFRGKVEPGSSGGPVVDASGRVVATVFARRAGSDDGYGVPNDAVQDALRAVGDPLDTACV